MVYQSAAGARDLLPLDVAQKRSIEEKLEQVFQRWGYHRIITSTLERMDTLMAGDAVDRSTVIQLQNVEDEELGLRPELTASIARTAVTRMANVSYPQRLCYNANVFVRSPMMQHNRQHEFYQAGVEFLGGGGLLADAEILLLVADCLSALSLQHWHLVLGEAGITRAMLAPFPGDLQAQVRSAIACLDYVKLDSLPLSNELRDRAKTILDLRGNSTDVLQRVSSLKLDPPQQDAVNNLKSLVELLQSQGNFSLILDLSLIQTFDYYTGIVFELVNDTDTQPQILGKGGRYDKLLGLYHPQKQNIPGIGFVFSVDNLYQLLAKSQQLPQTTPANNWLVIPENQNAYAAAFTYAQKLRNSTHLVQVEMDLGESTATACRQYARDRGIARIAWISEDGVTKIEPVVNDQ